MISAFIYAGEFNGVQLFAIRLLAKFNLRISDGSLRNLRQDGILKFHPFAKDRLKPDGGISYRFKMQCEMNPFVATASLELYALSAYRLPFLAQARLDRYLRASQSQVPAWCPL